MKKSIFSRIFLFNVCVVSVAMIGLAVLQYTLISNYIYKERVSELKQSASSMVRIINSEGSFENVERFLYGFSKSTGKNVLIIDNQNKIIMRAVNENTLSESAKYLAPSYSSEVFKGRENVIVGDLGGVYKRQMFTLQMPILSMTEKKTIGAVLISSDADEMWDMRFAILRIIGASLALLILLSLLFSLVISRGISTPIKKISIAAKSFAMGNFSSRVEKSKKGGGTKEIDELSDTFNEMASKIEKTEEIRNNFISDVSHELRTPMTTISGFVDGILDDTIPPERHKEYLGIVKEEIVRLSGLVNSFLDITRIKNGNPELEMTEFDINEMIRRTFINFRTRVEEKNISVDAEFETDSCYVKADEGSIKRILTNLIDNAVKFTDENGKIKISSFVKHQEVFVSIYNTGAGIREGELEMIFERFYKADQSRSINREGTGLGLYIVKDILRRHKKNISVKSREGEFAEFTFSLDKGKRRD